MKSSARGFTLVEVVVALGLMLAVTAVALTAVQATPDATAVQIEIADMHQRARVAVDSLLRDAIGASAILPYRCCGTSEDPAGTFRTDVVTFRSGVATTTYWLKAVDASSTYQLISWAGGTSPDVPVVDNVVQLAFRYDTDSGPLIPGYTAGDLLRIRSVGISLRIQAGDQKLRGPAGPLFAHGGTARLAGRWAPDVELQVQVAPRNLNLSR